MFVGHAIHLFMYNHKEHYCCDGEEGSWSKWNPADTSAKSTLWLRLEKEFLEDETCVYEPDWTHATICECLVYNMWSKNECRKKRRSCVS